MAETIHVCGESGVVWEMDLPLPEGVAQRLDRGDLTRVNPDGSAVAVEAPAEVDFEVPPAKNASREAWADYAVRVHGADVDDLEGLSRNELVELYGG